MVRVIWLSGRGTFTYDALARLNETKQFVNGVSSDLFVGKGIRYDKDGNLKLLERIEAGQPA